MLSFVFIKQTCPTCDVAIFAGFSHKQSSGTLLDCLWFRALAMNMVPMTNHHASTLRCFD